MRACGGDGDDDGGGGGGGGGMFMDAHHSIADLVIFFFRVAFSIFIIPYDRA